MKMNLPVTQREVDYPRDANIVSKTDLKGIVTYANSDFVNISGFTEEELIGKSHNLVRHPDMPSAAFEDLWKTVQSGKPWTGIVKNRCKNGDHYWVEAHVTPLYENGRMVGFQSVRKNPTRAQIAAAEKLYRRLNEGKSAESFLGRLNMLKNITIKGRLIFLTLLVFFITLGLETLLIRGINKEVDFVDKELLGLEYVRAAQKVAIQVAQHRGLATVWLSGDASAKERLSAKDLEVDDAVKALDGIDRRMGGDLASTQAWSGIKTHWSSLRSSQAGLSLADSFKIHTDLVQELLDLQSAVADSSNMSLDPEIDSYYSINVLVYQIPMLAEQLGRIRATGAGIAARKDITLPERVMLADLAANGRRAQADTVAGMNKVFDKQPKMKDELEGGVRSLQQSVESFSTLVEKKLLYAEKVDLAPKEIFDAATVTITAVMTPYDDIATTLDALLTARRDAQAEKRLWSIGLSAFILAVVVAGMILLLRAVTGPLDRAFGYFERMARGDLNVQIEIERQDEIAKILEAAKHMQIKLGADMEEMRRAADDATRVLVALDSSSANVMVADNGRNIVFINNAFRSLFRAVQADIRQRYPQFDVDKLIGQNIDQFHKNPDNQRHILANFTTSHTVSTEIGGHTFKIVASPVINSKGERLGSISEWNDITQELAAEQEISRIVAAAAQGDLEQRMQVNDKSGFFKQIGISVNELTGNASAAIQETNSALEKIAEGDLTAQIVTEYQGAFKDIKDNINATVGQLTEIITRIKEATDAINTASKEIATGNQDLSQRTEEQASSLEETASSMEELASTVKQNAENAKQANQMAVAASEVAVRGGAVVDQVVGTMSAINDASRKIVDIISVIDGIAFQTNILALNAAVEAARAGEQGRGFAVVAGEVRNLAQRSAAAAKEIKTLIGDSVDKVENGAKLVEEAGRTMEEIVASVKRVTDIMAEIAAASVEQSSGIEQVNQAITQMDEVTQQNAALVEEAAAAAESLEEQAQNLAQAVSLFRLQQAGSALAASRHVAHAPSRAAPRLAEQRPKKSASSAQKKPGKASLPFEDEGDDWKEF